MIDTCEMQPTLIPRKSNITSSDILGPPDKEISTESQSGALVNDVSASKELALKWTSQSETIEADPTQFCPQRRNHNYSSLLVRDCHCVITVREVYFATQTSRLH